MSKFSFFFGGNPTNKTETGTDIHGGLLIAIANHLDQSSWSTNQKYWAAVMCNYYTLFGWCTNCIVLFTSHGKLHESGAEKPISWAKPAHFDFVVINFTIWSHILTLISLDVLAICKRQRNSSIHCPLSQLLLPERHYLVGKDSVFVYGFWNDK
jgi:hypothetical protein